MGTWEHAKTSRSNSDNPNRVQSEDALCWIPLSLPPAESSASKRNQIILIGLVVLVRLMAEGLLVANYVQLTKNIQQNFTPASKLLPQISELRLEVLRLESVTLAALVNEGSDFTTANLLRLQT